MLPAFRRFESVSGAWGFRGGLGVPWGGVCWLACCLLSQSMPSLRVMRWSLSASSPFILNQLGASSGVMAPSLLVSSWLKRWMGFRGRFEPGFPAGGAARRSRSGREDDHGQVSDPMIRGQERIPPLGYPVSAWNGIGAPLKMVLDVLEEGMVAAAELQLVGGCLDPGQFHPGGPVMTAWRSACTSAGCSW